MAHFAELDQNNIVTQVIVISNDACSDVNGVESEEIGIAFCRKLYGIHTQWRQTSYNNNFRVRYAGVGYTYDEILDAFIEPKPYPSWTLNPDTTDWEAPVPMPPLTPTQIQEGYYYTWDEPTLSWTLEQGPIRP